MVDLPLLFAFLVAATILTLTPGVDTAMVLRAATVEGKRPAAMAALGIALGCLVWGGAVALGLGTLLRASERSGRKPAVDHHFAASAERRAV